MTTATSQSMGRRRPGSPRASRGLPARRLIRQASAWAPEASPRPMPLQELERTDDIRWVDLHAEGLENGETLALLGPICRGELTKRMVRDLITARRFPAGREYLGTRVSITAAFRTRHLQPQTGGAEPANVTSVFEPVQLLIGDDWLVSSWLPPRVFRGGSAALGDDAEDGGGHLFRAVAEGWPSSEGETAADLADLVRRELAIAAGYRVQAR